MNTYAKKRLFVRTLRQGEHTVSAIKAIKAKN